jgi:hypothetical protein
MKKHGHNLFVRKAQGKKQTIVDQLYNLFSNFQKQISMNHTKQLKHTKYQVHQKTISGSNQHNKTSIIDKFKFIKKQTKPLYYLPSFYI